MVKDIIKKEVKGNLPEPLRIGEMHYHLRVAGVRAVIENTIDALTQKLNAKAINIFIFSDYENIFSINDLKIKTSKKGEKIKIRKIDIRELNYNTTPAKNKTEFFKESYELKQRILKNIPLHKCSEKNPFVLHIHGLSLGKNPRLSAAINMLAEECSVHKKPLWILNQIHDFAENSRPEMLRNLQYCTGKRDDQFASQIMYPCTSNVFYATINSRDIENLLMVGIPKEKIFFLPNAVDTDFFTLTSIIKKNKYKQQLIEKLKYYAHKNDFVFDEKRKIVLSALKLMRRKNNIESLLLLIVFNYIKDEYQLLITLEGHSGRDAAYADMFKEFVKKYKLPVVIGLGREIISASESRRFEDGNVAEFNLVDIFALSRAVITTSILEGFGFAFVEGWLTDKPVIGRKIPYVCQDFEDNGLNLSHMYKKMWIPLNWIANPKKRIIQLYFKEANALRKKQGMRTISEKDIHKHFMKYKCKRMQNKVYIDFKELNAKMQFEIVEKILNSKHLIEELLLANPTIEKMYSILEKNPTSLISHNKKVVKKYYSLEAKAKRLRNIILLGNSMYLTSKSVCPISNRKVIEKYLNLDYIHPLTAE